MKTEYRKVKEDYFPLLAKNEKQDFIVLFTNESEGTVVHSSSATYPVGEHLDTWASVYNEECWFILKNATLVVEESK